MSGNESRSGNQEGESQRQPQQLEFITFTNPESARDAANQQLVRRHAMRDYHNRRTDRPRRKNEIELDITPLLERSAAMAAMAAGAARAIAPWDQVQARSSGTSREEGDEIQQRPPSPATVLGASRVDPFFRYPIQMGLRERELYNHLYDESCIMFRTMRDFGFLNRIRDSAAFCQFLSTSSWHMSHLLGGEENPDHLQYSVIATKELQKQIGDRNQCTTIDAVIAVLGFACCANLLNDEKALNVHLTGLQLILRERGGLESLDSDPVPRVVLYWLDLHSSAGIDMMPRFPQPTNLIVAYKQCHNQMLQWTNDVLDANISCVFRNPTIVQVAKDLRALQSLMRRELAERDLFNDTVFPGFNIGPIGYELLTMRSHLEENDERCALDEAFRLVGMIYIRELRAMFGIDPAPQAMYAAKLKNLLSYSDIDWAVADPILLWVIAVAVSARMITEEQRAWFDCRFKTVCQMQAVENFEDLMLKLSQIVWDEVIMRIESEDLKRILEW